MPFLVSLTPSVFMLRYFFFYCFDSGKALIDSFTQVPENKQLKLRCFVDSFPPANLTIVKEGHVLASTINNNILEYMVDGFDCLASGTYICQGFNGYNGEEPDSSSIHITTKCK